jgi:hypothetical protein
MKTHIESYNIILTKVRFFTKELHIETEKHTGRPSALKQDEVLAMCLFKQRRTIMTKISIFDIFKPKCSYKTLVVTMNKYKDIALRILMAILRYNREYSSLVKHTDSTDIPVCLNKNAKHHKTMHEVSSWGHSGKGFYYGIKLSITTDVKKQLLAVRFATARSDDRVTFYEMNKDLYGIFVADAGYISQELEKKFYQENKRILFTKPRANMKVLAEKWQNELYNTRFMIEFNFRSLKQFYGLVTSLPRSVDGYIANYTYSLLAFVLG